LRENKIKMKKLVMLTLTSLGPIRKLRSWKWYVFGNMNIYIVKGQRGKFEEQENERIYYES
jgi:hypothetical protein